MPYNGSCISGAATATAARLDGYGPKVSTAGFDILLVNASIVHSTSADAASRLLLRCISVQPRALLHLAWLLAAAGWLLQNVPGLTLACSSGLAWGLTSAAWLLQRYRSLHAGNWSFQVRALDDAGNYQNITAYPYATVNWTVALPSPYAEIQGGYTHKEGGCQVLSAVLQFVVYQQTLTRVADFS